MVTQGAGDEALPIVIRRIRADEGLRLRELRLRALTDAPTAFGSTAEEARLRPEQSWHGRAAENAAGVASVLFLAEYDDVWLGLAGGLFEAEAPGEAELVSMWLDPTVRGRGIAARLVEAVVDWARVRGVAQICLWVTEGNEPAIALYRRAGFAFTGEVAPLPSHPHLRERRMLRGLAEDD